MNIARIGWLTLLTLTAAAWLARAQSPITVFGEHPERGGTRVAYWDNTKNQAIGEVAIQFGRPA